MFFAATVRLWPRVGVAGGGDVKAEHHSVILMDHIMAVHRVPAQPVAEAHPHGHVAARDKPDCVLAGRVYSCFPQTIATRPAVLAAPTAVVVVIIRVAAVETGSALRRLELLHVHVDRMRPSEPAAAVPFLHGVLRDLEADGVGIAEATVRG